MIAGIGTSFWKHKNGQKDSSADRSGNSYSDIMHEWTERHGS